jgi:uncharacterized protein (TIGR02145 family)
MYASKTDTSVLNLASRLATKLNVTDTVSLSNRINANANSGSSDTSLLNLTTRLATKLNLTDTASLSNRIDGKLTKTDTASLSNRIDLKLTKTDTASLSNRIDLKLNRSDFPTGSNTGNILYWNGTIWVNLAPGLPGQVISMSSTGIPTWSNTAELVLPGAPTSVVATAGNSSASVAFVAPTNNVGSLITGYTVTTNPGNISVSGTTSPINVTGLTNGTAYTFIVVATNSVGNSAASTASTVVTPNACSTSTITDIDGNTYPTVSIGNQCWMSENLKTSRYRNGGLIPNVTDNTAWSNSTTGAWSYYNNDVSNNAIYGKLYKWYTTLGDTLCPTGWGVPTDAEWTTLTTYLGGESVAGGKMKSTGTDYWNSPNIGATNESGFSGLPGGWRYNDGRFFDIRRGAFFWSATELDNSNAWNRYLDNGWGNVDKNYGGLTNKSFGASFRCLRD